MNWKARFEQKVKCYIVIACRRGAIAIKWKEFKANHDDDGTGSDCDRRCEDNALAHICRRCCFQVRHDKRHDPSDVLGHDDARTAKAAALKAVH